MDKSKEYLISSLIYEIDIIFSTLKLREFYDNNDKKYMVWKFIFCIIHLLSASLSISSLSVNIYFKVFTLITCVLVVLFDNLDGSKIEALKTFNFEFIKKYYFELLIFPNIFIICYLCITKIKKCKNKEDNTVGKLLIEEDNENGTSNEDIKIKKTEL